MASNYKPAAAAIAEPEPEPEPELGTTRWRDGVAFAHSSGPRGEHV
jgi:hypothetical protein